MTFQRYCYEMKDKELLKRYFAYQAQRYFNKYEKRGDDIYITNKDGSRSITDQMTLLDELKGHYNPMFYGWLEDTLRFEGRIR